MTFENHLNFSTPLRLVFLTDRADFDRLTLLSTGTEVWSFLTLPR